MQGFSNGSGGQGCEGGAAGSFSMDTTLRRSVKADGEGRILSGLKVDLAAGFNFLFRNSALLG